jgi:hypothetical protein
VKLRNLAPETTQDELGAAYAVPAHDNRLYPLSAEVEGLAAWQRDGGEMIS